MWFDRRMRRPRSGRVVLLAAVCALAGAGPADAVTGDLTAAGCAEDPLADPQQCAVDAPGLTEARGVAVSPDGRSVYVVGRDGLVAFARADDGTLTPAGCVDGYYDRGCAQTVEGAVDLRDVVVSADGASVYAVGEQATLLRFDRAADGALTPRGCFEEGGPPHHPACVSVPWLGALRGVAVSPGGAHVYAVGSQAPTAIADVVTVFARAADGALTRTGCVIDDSGQVAGSGCVPTKGLDEPADVALSPDGTGLYVVSSREDAFATGGDDAVVAFARDATTGALTPVGCVEHADLPDVGCTPVTGDRGLQGARGVAVAPDGASVLVTAERSFQVHAFPRSAATGALAPTSACVRVGGATTACAPVNGMPVPLRAELAPDGAGPVVGGTTGIAWFGSPFAFRGCLSSSVTPFCAALPPLGDAWGVAFSPDGRSVYVVSRGDDAITTFAREVPAAPAPGEPAPAPAAGAAPPSSGGSTGTTTLAVTTPAAATLGRLAVVPTRFRAARRGATLAAAARPPVGARLRLTVNVPARLRLTLWRARPGIRRAGRCVPRRAGRRAGRLACTRYVRLRGAVTHRVAAGAVTLRFRGRWRGARLAVGRYRLMATATATTAGAAASAPRRAGFTIVR